MQEWEYKVVSEQREDENYINSLGKEGWEMCGIANSMKGATLYFRRQFFDPHKGIIA